LTPIDPNTKTKLKKTLSGVTELFALLESTLDRSLTDRYIDANQFITKYNHFRDDLFSLQPDDHVEEILTKLPIYVYTGDDVTDVVAVKQLLVEVYLKNSQLMAYLQNLLELD
jgi:muconolactone delta-isomerase